MSFFDYRTLITDRSDADYKRLLELKEKNYDALADAEKAEWDAGLKAGYNASDLNRITEAMVYMKNLYEHYGYQVSYTPVNITHADGTTDTTWRIGERPTRAQGALIVQNLFAFWVDAESAKGSVDASWADNEFGYIDVSELVNSGDHISFTEAHGIVEIIVVVKGTGIAASGDGWSVDKAASELTAKYTVPQGVFEDIQDALNTLVFRCTAKEYEDATVTVSALMRSGATIGIGSGEIHWSAIIKWNAFEAYGYTWQDVEDAQMTWGVLETLPIPTTGGTA